MPGTIRLPNKSRDNTVHAAEGAVASGLGEGKKKEEKLLQSAHSVHAFKPTAVNTVLSHSGKNLNLNH